MRPTKWWTAAAAVGLLVLAACGDNRHASPPSAGSSQTLACRSPRLERNAIRVPSGDQRGAFDDCSAKVAGCDSDPSVRPIQICSRYSL